MARFFVPKENIDADMLRITGEDVLHITKVLRMREGDTFTACDGEKTDYTCKLLSADKTVVVAKILEKTENTAEPKVHITLYQGIPKATKFDYIVQKCVEIGVCRIVPMKTDRVVKSGDSKTARLSKISLEAAKQSGRGIVPEIGEPFSFREAVLKAKEADLALFPYELETEFTLKKALRDKTPKSVSVLIGPEGGFSDEESEFAKENGLLVVTLGKRILRTETAGPVTCGNILYEMEE